MFDPPEDHRRLDRIARRSFSVQISLREIECSITVCISCCQIFHEREGAGLVASDTSAVAQGVTEILNAERVASLIANWSRALLADRDAFFRRVNCSGEIAPLIGLVNCSLKP
jgi:hypothetical protein